MNVFREFHLTCVKLTIATLLLFGLTTLVSPDAHAQTCSSNQKADVLLLLDQSGSINNDKVWDTAICNTVTAFKDKLRFGLMYFNNSAQLASDTQGDIGIADGNETRICTWLGTNKPSGSADYFAAFTAARAYWTTYLPTDPIKERPRYIILMSDKEHNGTDPASTITALHTPGLTINGFTYEIKTFAVGFGDAGKLPALDQYAIAGATTKAYYATNQAELDQALQDIANQAATEVCDNIDNDCDGQVDEGLTQACTGPCGAGTQTCTAGQWSTCSAQPVAETCDGTDNDCDGSIDEDFTNKGQACTAGVGACQATGTYVCKADGTGTECNATAGTPTTETCNNIDDDCDGTTDEGVTRTCQTACGTGTETCSAGSFSGCTAPQPQTETCDGVDNDCNGQVDDNPSCTCAINTTQPCGSDVGACQKGTQTCVSDGNGGTQWGPCTGQTTATAETCNGQDDDCDGTTDEGLTRACYSGPLGTEGTGVCKGGTQTCSAGAWGTCTGEVIPKGELCNNLDDDCDGQVDETFTTKGNTCSAGVGACKRNGTIVCKADGTGVECNATPGTPGSEDICFNGVDDDCDGTIDNRKPTPCPPCQTGETRTCYSGITGTAGVGPCKSGTQTCSATGQWGTCTGEVTPSPELCDAIDNDCDGQIDETFADKGKDCTSGQGECRQPGKLVCNSTNTGLMCNITNPVSPTQETCDNKDNDCDGQIDNGVTRNCFSGNATNRGRGLCKDGVQICSGGQWSTSCTGEVLPAPETCDGRDEDCDGIPDNGFNLGQACEVGVGACKRTGTLVCKADASGAKCSVVAGTPVKEVCGNGKDDDCDGQTDDKDECGECKPPGAERSCYNGPSGTAGIGECKAGKQTCGSDYAWSTCTGFVNPGTETCDGKDNDCNGRTDENLTRSCKTICESGTETCQNGQWQPCTARKPVKEVCGDQVDDDCDGSLINGCIGFCPTEGATQPCYTGPDNTAGVGNCKQGKQTCTNNKWGPCTDEVKPATETCDGKDEDCDGSIDEGLKRECKTDCGAGEEICKAGTYAGCTAPQPTTEICDGKDNDCDGTTDEDCICKPGEARSCYTGPADTKGVGTCKDGTQTCKDGKSWSDCTGEVKPKAAEICGNQEDDDCNGKVDDGCVCQPGDTKKCQQKCGEGTQKCTQQDTWGPCEGAPEPEIEICDGKDNDCNGLTDDGMIRGCKTKCGDGIQTCNGGSWGQCQGQQPSDEICDGVDNDCDGTVDNGAQCANGATCTDGSCPRPCVNGECPKGFTCTDGACIPKTTCDQVVCPPGNSCSFGKCYDPCDSIKCPNGFVCWKGKCAPGDCYALGCPSGQVCKEGKCQNNPCAGISCQNGEYCKDGNCIKSCDGVTCGDGESCKDGSCSKDPCAGVKCDPGKTCFEGKCFGDPCKDVVCPKGRTCELGKCSDDPCSTIQCNGKLTCKDGQCIDACAGKNCPSGQACLDGNCVVSVCYNTGCGEGKICVESSCQDDPCKSVNCNADAFCRAGTCINVCTGVQCKTGERCKDGACEPDPCNKSSCGDGESCIEGKCIVNKCKDVNCDKGRVCDAESGGCVDDPCLNISCPKGSVCKTGQCIGACEGVVCPKDFKCQDGACVQDGCYTTGCEDGKICKGGTCVGDPCAGKTCGENEFCKAGSCVKSCAGVKCADDELCFDGTCNKNLCNGVKCDPGKYCDPADGTCKDNGCAGVFCGAGRKCNPKTGQCDDDPCLAVKCPGDQICDNGTCTGNPAPTLPDGAKAEVPAIDEVADDAGNNIEPNQANPDKETGNEGPSVGTDPNVVRPGCTCSSASPFSSSGGLMFFFLFLLVLKRSARRSRAS